MSYCIRQLSAPDLPDYRTLRLQALTQCPAAFGATPRTEQALDDAQILQRFNGGPGQIMWGGFDEHGLLCATLGMYRDTGEKTLGGFKPEVQHLPPSKVRRCHHLVRPRHTSNFSLKSASPLPV